MGDLFLTLVTFFPLLGAVLLLFVPRNQHDTIKGVTLIISFITLLISFAVYQFFDPHASGMQFEWTSLGAFPRYSLSSGYRRHLLLLIVLTTVLTVLCVLASWNSITHGVKVSIFRCCSYRPA